MDQEADASLPDSVLSIQPGVQLSCQDALRMVSGLMWELTYFSPSLLLRIITYSPSESARGTQMISFNRESQHFSTAIEQNNGLYSLVLAPTEGLLPWSKYYRLADSLYAI